jgi:cyclophilin family peptidyl-prolyl cis-trans isomerase
MSPMAVLLAAALFAGDGSADSKPAPDRPRVQLETTLGTITLELDPTRAPKSVENFLGYVRAGHYDGTIFHRVIKGFMVQGGGFDAQLRQKATRAPIQNEADNGLKNQRGTIAMARTNDPHSASSQFFVNTVDNRFLDHTAKNERGWGYAVFGKVVEGMGVVDAIEAVRTGPKGPFREDVPQQDVVILRAKVVE